MEPASQYIVKFSGGASGVRRYAFDSAVETAVMYRPAIVYRVGAPNVKMAVVHVDGGIDFTPEGAEEQRS